MDRIANKGAGMIILVIDALLSKTCDNLRLSIHFADGAQPMDVVLWLPLLPCERLLQRFPLPVGFV